MLFRRSMFLSTVQYHENVVSSIYFICLQWNIVYIHKIITKYHKIAEIKLTFTLLKEILIIFIKESSKK